jgi:preprotein translocase subunit SecG
MYTILIILLIADCFLLGTVVLLQAGKGGGLAAMGGGSSTESFFGGRQATTILTKMSWWCGGVFLGLSLILAGLSTGRSTPTSVLQENLGPPTPVAPGAPLPLDVQPQGEPGQGPATTEPPPGGQD